MAGENRVSLSHSGRTFGLQAMHPLSHDGPYVYIRSRYCMSAQRVFKEKLIFSPLSTYFSNSKANKGFLGPSNIDYNLYAKQQR